MYKRCLTNAYRKSLIPTLLCTCDIEKLFGFLNFFDRKKIVSNIFYPFYSSLYFLVAFLFIYVFQVFHNKRINEKK